jgi:hypothetical protein
MQGTKTRWFVRGTLALVAAAVLASGCAAIRREEARSEESLLAAAGFQMRAADTPARQAQLQSLPPLKMEMRAKDGDVVYTYADPDNCKCLWVGGPRQYQEYRKLALKQQMAEDQMEAAEAEEEASMDWGMWGPWGPW